MKTIFMLNAFEEGICYANGKSVMDVPVKNDMILSPDGTLSFMGWASAIVYNIKK